MAPRRPFPVDPVLTAIAIAYRNPAVSLIADMVCPRVPVGGEEFKYLEYNLADHFTIPDTRIGRTGKPNQVEFSADEKTEHTDDYGLDNPIPNSDITTAANMRSRGLGNYDPEKHSAMSLTDIILLDREKRAADLYQNSANYDAGRKITLAGGDQFSDYANSDPIEVLKTAINGTLIYRANSLIMGFAVWEMLSSHPVLVNAIRGNLTNKGIITKQELASLLEIQNIYVGEGFVNTARKGQAVNLQRAWGNSIVAAHINSMARPEGGITFALTGQYGSRISGSIEDPDIGLEGGRRNRVGEKVKEFVVAKDVAYLIQNPIA